MDILFCGSTHRVKKFVLRTNVPGHPLFNMYIKCNFVLALNSGPLANGHSSLASPWQEEGMLGPTDAMASPGMVCTFVSQEVSILGERIDVSLGCLLSAVAW